MITHALLFHHFQVVPLSLDSWYLISSDPDFITVSVNVSIALVNIQPLFVTIVGSSCENEFGNSSVPVPLLYLLAIKGGKSLESTHIIVTLKKEDRQTTDMFETIKITNPLWEQIPLSALTKKVYSFVPAAVPVPSYVTTTWCQALSFNAAELESK